MLPKPLRTQPSSLHSARRSLPRCGAIVLMFARCAVNLDPTVEAQTDTAQAQVALTSACTCTSDADCDGVAASCSPADHVCLMRCPSVTIDSAQALTAARHCREIEGNLLLTSQDIEAIGPDALPYLERVSGNLLSIGSKPMRELTLPNLREVGSAAGDALVEISLDGASLQRVSLPKLHVVHGDFSLFGLYALQTLEVPQLREVERGFSLINLPRLRTLQLARALQTGENSELTELCSLPAAGIEVPEAVLTRDAVGCCTSSAVACSGSLCQCDP